MFWNNFVSLCTNLGKSTTAVILELGFSRSSVTSWKNGTKPNNTALLKIANYFNVTVDYLLNDNSKQKETPPEELPAGLDEKDIEILNMYSRLSDEQKQQALSYLQFLKSQRTEGNQ